MKKAANAFTLVELLVVIAIISVLAAMLLPTLADALEMGRRTVCANNQKQLYLSIVTYANDWNDRLPYQAHVWTYGNVSSGEVYWVPAGGPMRHFLAGYVGLNMPINATTINGLIKGTGTVALCPSRPAPNPSAGYGSIHYGFPMFGVYDDGSPTINVHVYGTTRFSLVSATRRYPRPAWGPATMPVAPSVMVMDFMSFTEEVLLAHQKGQKNLNHAQQGGNAVKGDGSCRWLPSEYWVSPLVASNRAPGLGHYVQRDRGGMFCPFGNYNYGFGTGSAIVTDSPRSFLGYKK